MGMNAWFLHLSNTKKTGYSQIFCFSLHRHPPLVVVVVVFFFFLLLRRLPLPVCFFFVSLFLPSSLPPFLPFFLFLSPLRGTYRPASRKRSLPSALTPIKRTMRRNRRGTERPARPPQPAATALTEPIPRATGATALLAPPPPAMVQLPPRTRAVTGLTGEAPQLKGARTGATGPTKLALFLEALCGRGDGGGSQKLALRDRGGGRGRMLGGVLHGTGSVVNAFCLRASERWWRGVGCCLRLLFVGGRLTRTSVFVYLL